MGFSTSWESRKNHSLEARQLKKGLRWECSYWLSWFVKNVCRDTRVVSTTTTKQTHLRSHIRCDCTNKEPVDITLPHLRSPNLPLQEKWSTVSASNLEGGNSWSLNADKLHITNLQTLAKQNLWNSTGKEEIVWSNDYLLKWILKQGFPGDVNLNVLRHRQLLRGTNTYLHFIQKINA